MNHRGFDFALAAVYVLLTVSSVICIKLGLKGAELRLGSPTVIKITPLLFIGLIGYVASFVLWIPVLARFELSYIFPLLAGSAQLLLLAGAIWILGEAPTPIQLVGALAVAVGLVLLNVGSRA